MPSFETLTKWKTPLKFCISSYCPSLSFTSYLFSLFKPIWANLCHCSAFTFQLWVMCTVSLVRSSLLVQCFTESSLSGSWCSGGRADESPYAQPPRMAGLDTSQSAFSAVDLWVRLASSQRHSLRPAVPRLVQRMTSWIVAPGKNRHLQKS